MRLSILKRAFAGRLVPQDPADEPADKLLERIKKQRGSQGQQGNDKMQSRRKVRNSQSNPGLL